MIFFFKRTKNMRGFTLIELLVSLAIFTSVITIAVGALFSAQAVNARLEQTQLILDGVNLAVEVMSRDIRYGAAYRCDTALLTPLQTNRLSCPYTSGIGGTALIFKPSVRLPQSIDSLTDRVAYYLSNGAIYKDEYWQAVPGTYTKQTYQITPSDVQINTLTFFVNGAEQGDSNQPLITMIVSGTTIPRKSNVKPVTFTVQTSASSRALDN